MMSHQNKVQQWRGVEEGRKKRRRKREEEGKGEDWGARAIVVGSEGKRRVSEGEDAGQIMGVVNPFFFFP